MADFLLELLSEEIPARMQAKACKDLQSLFEAELAKAGLAADSIETWATPRRLALVARNLPAGTEAVSEELKGPRAGAPPQALEGFLRKTGLGRDRLVERDGIFFATIDKPGRAAASVLAEAIPAIVRAFPWPRSMRWGEASASTESPRWVRPLHGIVALLGEEIVEFEIAGVKSGAATVGHRFHHPGTITIGGAHDYAEKLRACHVVLDPAERCRIIAEGAARAAAGAGLTLVQDDGLTQENAGLTEWPVALLGSFDPAFLGVPREVIQLTMRTNQKYFALLSSPAFDGEGDRAERGEGASSGLAPNFVCVANIEATDGGGAIAAGNERVLSARLADAKFFWEQDLKVPLEEQAKKLGGIVFHDKLGTVADKVERVAKLARWLVEEGIVKPSRHPGEGRGPARNKEELDPGLRRDDGDSAALAALAETAARLCKADLVTGLVGEFPELQGVIGGHLARAQGERAEVADAISDHYKPVGQGDDVPTAPITVAVSLADKLDTVIGFFGEGEFPTGSRDPFALRRAALGIVQLFTHNTLRADLVHLLLAASYARYLQVYAAQAQQLAADVYFGLADILGSAPTTDAFASALEARGLDEVSQGVAAKLYSAVSHVRTFFADRLKVQQREAGVRPDLINAVFALGGEDDIVRLLARVKALQAFVETAEGRDLLAGYKRAANILKKENWASSPSPRGGEGRGEGAPAPEDDSQGRTPSPYPLPEGEGKEEQARNKTLSYTPEKEETALIAALDSAEPRAAAAIEAEDFEGAMAALASLRAPVDAFFDKVIVNDPEPDKRAARLDLLMRMRDAVHRVADFSRIEG